MDQSRNFSRFFDQASQMVINKQDTGAGKISKSEKKPIETGISVVPISDLVPDPTNVRKHTDRNKSAVSASLKRFGPGRSVVIDRANMVIAGNQTIESAPLAGINEVVIIEPAPNQIVAVKRSDWTNTEATAYAIADNRTAELAEWDFQAAGQQLSALKSDGFDLLDLGWEPYEAEPLMMADWTPKDSPADESNPADDDARPHSVTFSAEAWQVVCRACDRVRALEEEDIADRRAIELICADWLNDPNWHER